MTSEDRISTAHLIQTFAKNEVGEPDIQAFKRLKVSHDQSVRLACEIIEDYADTYDDDPSDISKEDWNHLERVRLALLSGSQLAKHGEYSFALTNLLSAIGFLIFVACSLQFGFTRSLFPVGAGLALSMWTVSKLMARNERGTSPYFEIIKPFTSFQQLASAYRSTDSFTKHRIPRQKLTDDGMTWYELMFAAFLIPLVTPFALALLSLPSYKAEYTVDET